MSGYVYRGNQHDLPPRRGPGGSAALTRSQGNEIALSLLGILAQLAYISDEKRAAARFAGVRGCCDVCGALTAFPAACDVCAAWRRAAA